MRDGKIDEVWMKKYISTISEIDLDGEGYA